MFSSYVILRSYYMQLLVHDRNTVVVVVVVVHFLLEMCDYEVLSVSMTMSNTTA